MKIVYLDTIAGIAGDMTMSALVSAGVPLDDLVRGLRGLPVGGFELQASHVRKQSIAAVHIDVVVSGEPAGHRHLRDVLSIIGDGDLPGRVKARSADMFRVIAEAEAAVHGTTVDRVHFHEVGAVDSIVDIVGVALCLEYLDVEAVYTSPVRLGAAGFVRTQHGRMPVPTPAVLEILRGYPTVLGVIPHELTTPTGAAIVKALSRGILGEETLRVQAIGYGAGTLELDDVPNVLRAVVGEILPTEGRDEVVVIETNIDDMNPQAFPFVLEKLLGAGALDAWLHAVVMKKGRPGIVLSALAERSRLDDVVRVLTLQTSTIGVRMHAAMRRILPRRSVEVDTRFGRVRAKAVIRDGREMLAPEFEECRRIADDRGIPLLDVMRALESDLSPR
jgi:pyridinium-3,5-bisthiocarboxylic acid mononucleotide nickel chelatase